MIHDHIPKPYSEKMSGSLGFQPFQMAGCTQKCALLGQTKGPACCITSYHLLFVEVGEASIHKPSTRKRTSKPSTIFYPCFDVSSACSWSTIPK